MATNDTDNNPDGETEDQQTPPIPDSNETDETEQNKPGIDTSNNESEEKQEATTQKIPIIRKLIH